jgi:hypothetical protein
MFVSFAQILHLHAGGQVLRTTAMHPFWVVGKGWLEAENLTPGDILGSHDGQNMMVEEVFDTGETETVYNLRIADYHTYFVGCPEWGWSVWAHNACSSTSGNNLASQKGRAAHKAYNPGPTYRLNKPLANGMRPDAVDPVNRIVRELKPNNPAAIAKGWRQVNRYRQALQNQFGGIWKAYVDVY